MPGTASSIVLPQGVNPGLTVWVPKGYERENEVKIGLCRVCGAKFYKGQEVRWQKHVGKCAKANIDDLRANSLRNRHGGIFNEDEWSPEAAAHLKRVGKQMLKEGRLEMRPNERVHNE